MFEPRRNRQGQRPHPENLRPRERSKTMKASNFKPQASGKFQMTNSTRQTTPTPHRFWSLELGASLVLGARCLEFRRLGLLCAIFALAIPAAHAQQPKKLAASAWEHSIVTIEVARKQYDYYQPWSKQMRKLQKVGTVVNDHQILTTADHMSDRTLVRLQKGGRGKWTIGEVTWLDYHANLAPPTTSA